MQGGRIMGFVVLIGSSLILVLVKEEGNWASGKGVVGL